LVWFIALILELSSPTGELFSLPTGELFSSPAEIFAEVIVVLRQEVGCGKFDYLSPFTPTGDLEQN
jgi:hypothetical protein